MPNLKRKDFILSLLFLFSVFILSIIKIEDTDTWTHLSFGRWIWENKAIPLFEPFIKTSPPFPYNNWLFGFSFYVAYHFFNVYGVILLKAVIVTIAFLIILRDSLRPHKNISIAIAVMATAVIMSRTRFVERPDIFLMVFLPFSIFSLNAFIYENKKYIYALPLIHMLWANSHTSLPLMFVPFGAFIAGGMLQRHLNKLLKGGDRNGFFSLTPSPTQIKVIFLIFVFSFLASLISPYFINQYAVSSQALASDWWKQEIMELQKPRWNNMKYPFVMAPLVLLTFILDYIFAKKQKRGTTPLIHLILVTPFLYLSFTAMRFIFLAAIISGPVVARNISGLLKDVKSEGLLSKRIGLIIPLVIILIYPVLILKFDVGPFSNERKITGFGINYDEVPEGALKYMDRRGIYGNVFNLFQWGGYIIWRDFPKRRPMIDGRGFLDAGLLEKTIQFRKNSAVVKELENKYGFQAILLTYPILITDTPEAFAEIDIAFHNLDWALVYWDDNSLLYLRRYKDYDGIIKEDEYRFIKPANGIRGIKPKIHDKDFRDNLIKELLRNAKETGSAKAYTYLGFAYNEAGQFREAIAAYNNALRKGKAHLLDVYDGLAYAYLQLGDTGNSIRFYEKALSVFRSPSVLYKLGVIYLAEKKDKVALEYLKEALSKNPYLVSIYPMLMDIYRRLNMKEELQRITRLYEKATIESGGEAHFKEGLKAYMSGSYEVAIREFKKSIEINPSNPVPYSNVGYIYYDIGDMTRAFEYHRKALEIDPNHANSHYGLALIYKRWGDYDRAKHHWREYLRIEPAGYYSRRAKEELMLIDNLQGKGN